ncbi:hypothetical protein [Desulfobulbus alkaliphilus]|uniref:hypothetical protein n=1 Tax=Desulfobulbus alkaliphilus TaxID=869814 RepID=UPI001963939E|nr:hypothetical protein [Desulfobulbus alkaliphilus]MBM9535710.1 hypothetical protein [Desulfobulbus alkaliphilus]
MGFHRDGGFAEYILAPLASTIPIPEGCSFDHAVMAEPLSCSLNALELAVLKPDERIGIWGGGPAGGMDELSICDPSTVHEFSGQSTKTAYTLRPEDVGLRPLPFEHIAATSNLTTERRRFLGVLTGRGYQGCIDFTCLNAEAALYIGEKAESITKGVNMAKEAIASGAAIAKLQRWVAVQSDDPEQSLARLRSELRTALGPAAAPLT